MRRVLSKCLLCTEEVTVSHYQVSTHPCSRTSPQGTHSCFVSSSSPGAAAGHSATTVNSCSRFHKQIGGSAISDLCGLLDTFPVFYFHPSSICHSEKLNLCPHWKQIWMIFYPGTAKPYRGTHYLRTAMPLYFSFGVWSFIVVVYSFMGLFVVSVLFWFLS